MFIPPLEDDHLWVRAIPRSEARDADLQALCHGMCADVNVYCSNDPPLKLHKLTLGLRSAFLRQAFQDMANSNPSPEVHVGPDGIDKAIFINGVSKDEITIAMVYLYAEQYPLSLLDAAMPWECYRIFAVADRLGLPGLKSAAFDAARNSLLRILVHLDDWLPKAAAEEPDRLRSGDLAAILRAAVPEVLVDQLQTMAAKAAPPPPPAAPGAAAALRPMLESFVDLAWAAVCRVSDRRGPLPTDRSAQRLAGPPTGFGARKLREFAAELVLDTVVTSQGFRLSRLAQG